MWNGNKGGHKGTYFDFNLSRRMVNLLRRLSIRKRIIGSLLLVSIFPVILVGIYSNANYEQSVSGKLESYSGQLIQEVSQNVESEVNQYEKLSEVIMADNDVKNDLLLYPLMTYSKKNDMYHRLDDKFDVELFDYKNVQDISIWSSDGKVVYDMGYISYAADSVKKAMQRTDGQRGNAYWTCIRTNSGENCIVLSRQIYLDYTYQKIGYLLIFIDEQIFANDTYRNIDLGAGSNLFIFQPNGMVISTNSDSPKDRSETTDPVLVDRYKSSYEHNSSSFHLDSKAGNYIYACNYIPSLDWYVVGKIPYRYISLQTEGVRNSILLFCLLIIVFSIALSSAIYASIYYPLKNLAGYAQQITLGRRDISLQDIGKDEIGGVSKNITQMVKQLESLVNEVATQQSQKRIAELNMLQAQINPHFLFNTLNSLRWSAMLSGNKTLEAGIGALSSLLQNTIINNSEFIFVEDEIENVDNYAVIQKIRYADSFTLHYDVAERVKKAWIPKFILQPIIENSIIHGLWEDKRITHISVKATESDHTLSIEIRDDGCGFNVEEMEKEMEKGGANKKLSGIGIANVDERIRLIFGKPYGLRTESTPGVGTVSHLTMPLLFESGDLRV